MNNPAGTDTDGTSQDVTLEGMAALDLKQVKAYPSPYQPGSGGSQDAAGITFANLTEDAKIEIYDQSGALVIELNKNDKLGTYLWDARNSKGEPVASGTYLYRVTNSNKEKHTGRIAVIR